MPGSNARALEKAKSLDCDVVILDLEDAVAPEAKELARRQVTSAVIAGGFGHREVVVRINSLETPWGVDDWDACAALDCAGILLPKVESPELVREHGGKLDASQAKARLWCMIETPKGVLAVERIAAAHPRVECLVLGTSDLTKDLRALHTSLRLPMLTSLGLALLAARAYGLTILDGVHLDLEDEVGLCAACLQGRELGFNGKTLIHPKQLAACHAAFSPSAADVQQAARIVAAHAAAATQGQGLVVLDGRLIESLHVAEAKRTLALASALQERSSPSNC